jgi:hypothetical protein
LKNKLTEADCNSDYRMVRLSKNTQLGADRFRTSGQIQEKSAEIFSPKAGWLNKLLKHRFDAS